MARTAKAATNLQVFRGSKPRQDVFALHSNEGCCDGALVSGYDKLGSRTRFDNALAHSNPTGANDKIHVPNTGLESDHREIVDWINANGVGATISVLALPTYSFLTGVMVTVLAAEAGLTFDLITRNGAVLPTDQLITVIATGSACEVTRTQGVSEDFAGFGALTAGQLYRVIIARDSGNFVLEADELMLRVATMPAGGLINGDFRLRVAASYDVIDRAPV